jgi:hypothetical protein
LCQGLFSSFFLKYYLLKALDCGGINLVCSNAFHCNKTGSIDLAVTNLFIAKWQRDVHGYNVLCLSLEDINKGFLFS